MFVVLVAIDAAGAGSCNNRGNYCRQMHNRPRWRGSLATITAIIAVRCTVVCAWSSGRNNDGNRTAALNPNSYTLLSLSISHPHAMNAAARP
jgi:hypothetical protein